MKTIVISFLVFSASTLFGAKIGDTLEQVLEEKGKPLSQVDAGAAHMLTYADRVIQIKDGIVVAIKTREEARGPAMKVITPNKRTLRAHAIVGASEEGWTTDYPGALAQAKSDNRKVFLLFTGSDWCIWCKRLEGEILSSEEFKGYARDNLVLVKLDFPRQTPQPDEIKHQNQALAKQYQIRGYPTIIILNADGSPAAQMGYQKGGPSPFLQKLSSL
jgi:protein disulfide-isomerase